MSFLCIVYFDFDVKLQLIHLVEKLKWQIIGICFAQNSRLRINYLASLTQ